jgi:hypothetical protein
MTEATGCQHEVASGVLKGSTFWYCISLSDLVLPTIEEYGLARDAEVRRDGDTFNLVLLVDYAIDPNCARQIGDN